MATFLEEYLRHTSIYESPSSFWRWSGYLTIAAILKDKCYLRSGDSFLFPNMYVLFLAESSGHRKGRPVELSESLVNKINTTKIISGRSSVQAILDELARAETDKASGKVIKSSSAVIYAPELAAGLVNDSEGLKILTDLYDFKPNAYKNRLRTGPCFNLERVVLNMLSATNEDMIKDFFGISEIKGGLLARTFLVTPNEHRKSNSLLHIDQNERKESLSEVLKNLFEVSKLHGDYFFEPDAIKEYEDWYGPFRDSYEKKKEATGVVGRIHTGVIKIAMVLAANELLMSIKKRHVEQAIDQCLSLIPNYSIFTMHTAKNEISQAAGLIVTELVGARNYMMSLKEIKRKMWQTIPGELIEKALATLDQAGMVTTLVSREGEFWKLSKYCLEVMGLEGTEGNK